MFLNTMTQKPGPNTTTDIPAQQPGMLLPVWMSSFKMQAVIVALLSIVIYANTFQHEYALDDTVVIIQNDYVHEGFAGLPGIFTKDAYDSYFRLINSTNQLSGGRYRPLSIATFAIEQQFMGAVSEEEAAVRMRDVTIPGPVRDKFLEEMHIRHVFNVLWYALAIVTLLYFLRYVVFKNNPIIAFVAVLLFTVHPLHTEIVANVKSRDEILSMLFICLTFIFAFRYREQKKTTILVAGLASLGLALLAKEYAITLVLLLPMAFYLFSGDSVKKSIIAFLPYLAVVIVYLLWRYQVIGSIDAVVSDDLQINPYALATDAQKQATEVATMVNYLKLLIFPHPLSSDYSYNTIPYKDFTHPLFWLSVVVHIVLIGSLIWLLRKRHVLAFALGFYLFNLLLVCNLLFDIGATMGERLVFHSSVGFVMVAAVLLYNGAAQIKDKKTGQYVLATVMVALVALCSIKTINRNKNWKNDYTLFTHDLEVVPNSFLVNTNVAGTLVNNSDQVQDEAQRIADLKRGVALFTKAVSIHKTYILGHMNRGVAYIKLGYADSALADMHVIRKLNPMHPQLPYMFYHTGMVYYNSKKYDEAAAAWKEGLEINPGDPELEGVLNKLQAERTADTVK